MACDFRFFYLDRLNDPPVTMSYYQVIEGVKYDRALLEKAHELTEGRGDGRISQADAKALYISANDGGRITMIELRTLSYIGHTFTWTDSARVWFEEKLFGWPPIDVQAETEKILRVDYQLEGTKAQIDVAAVEAQSKLDNKVPYNLSVMEAIEAVLTDHEHSESPLQLILQIHQIEIDDAYKWREEATKILREHLNKGTIRLWNSNAEDAPPNGESLQDNWIFHMHLPSLSDHQFWIIVDRSGEREAFVYGFN